MTVTRWRRIGRFAVGSALLSLMLGAAGPGAPTTRAATSPVLLDAHGTCPADPASHRSGGQTPTVCRLSKFGNVETGEFLIPKGPWGLTWSFRCPKAMDFVLVVHLPSLDGVLPATSVYRHGRQGRGYEMETNNWQMSLDSVFPTQYRNPQDLVVNSTCSWHALVVKGRASVVKRYVPPLPPLDDGAR